MRRLHYEISVNQIFTVAHTFFSFGFQNASFVALKQVRRNLNY